MPVPSAEKFRCNRHSVRPVNASARLVLSRGWKFQNQYSTVCGCINLAASGQFSFAVYGSEACLMPKHHGLLEMRSDLTCYRTLYQRSTARHESFFPFAYSSKTSPRYHICCKQWRLESLSRMAPKSSPRFLNRSPKRPIRRRRGKSEERSRRTPIWVKKPTPIPRTTTSCYTLKLPCTVELVLWSCLSDFVGLTPLL